MNQTAKRTKVCHVVLLPELDGAQRCMFELCRRLDKTSYECHVICNGEGPLTKALANEGIPYHVVASLERPIHLARDVRALLDLRRVIRTQRFDIVHTHSSKPGFLGRCAARLAGVRNVVHHVQGFPFHEFSKPLRRMFFIYLERFAGRLSSRVIFVNNEERELAVRNGWLPESKCLTIANGVDLELYRASDNDGHGQEFRRENSLATDETLILVSGRLDRQKQSLILPEIARRLEQQRPEARWRILVLGKGILEEKLKTKTAKLGVGHRIRLLGWTDRPWEVTRAADIALLPSLWEGLPLVLLEAQAAGRPIVASRIKGNREVVVEGTGVLCDPSSPSAYAEALAELLDDPERRASAGATAQRRAAELYSIEAALEQLEEVYREMKDSLGPLHSSAAPAGHLGTG